MNRPPGDSDPSETAPTPERDTATSKKDTSTQVDVGDAVQVALRELGPVVTAIALVCMIAPAVAGFLAIARAGAVKTQFLSWEGSGPWLYGIGFALLTGCAMMPTYALSGIAGFTFGASIGSVVAVAGVVGGAVVGYLLAMILTRHRVMAVIQRHPRASVIREALVERGAWTELGVVTLLRLPPNSPFALTNLAMSATRVNPVAFVFGTLAGMSPRTVLAAAIGAAIGAGAESLTKEEMARKGSSLLGVDLRLVGIGVTLVVLVVIYVLFSRWSKAALRRRFGTGMTATGSDGKAAE